MGKSKSKAPKKDHPNHKLYVALIKAYQNAKNKSYEASVTDMSVQWQLFKKSPDFPENVKVEIASLQKQKAKKQITIESLWAKKKPKQPNGQAEEMQTSKPSRPSTTAEASEVDVIANRVSASPIIDLGSAEAPVIVLEAEGISGMEPDEDVIGVDEFAPPERIYATPADDKLVRESISLQKDVVHLTDKRDSGVYNEDELKQLQEKRRRLVLTAQKLKKLRQNKKNQRSVRLHKNKIDKQFPEMAKKYHRHPKRGRRRLEEDQPGLLKTIVDIAIQGSSCDDRRRSEAFRSIKTLDELHKEMQEAGFSLSRSALYLRLLPRRSSSLEGKRHLTTVPVRLKRAANNAHKSHGDTHFCKATIYFLEQIASVLGPEGVLFISQDDKARVPLGITAANKQAPMLMHVEYAVKLPDHDWVVAERHKLIPSVYGIMEVKPEMMGDRKAVSYSGPTFIAIRSGKHCSSTALSHSKDLNTLLGDQDYYKYTRNQKGDIKPVLIIIVDGGPDENPRYEKVIAAAINHFQKHNFDAIFIATNAPGRSAFNRVERRMAPLSRELCGVILPYEYYGTHLDSQGRTVDEDLEKQNFEKAGEVLAEIWNGVIIDGFPTKAIYVPPTESEQHIGDASNAEWRSRHVRESHYFLQIVKCEDQKCCKAFRGNYNKLFPPFVPGPVCFEQKTLTADENLANSNKFTDLFMRLGLNSDPLKNKKSGEVPYDLCCPSLQDLIEGRICKKCGLYFASIKSMKSHKTFCKTHSAPNAQEDAFAWASSIKHVTQNFHFLTLPTYPNTLMS